MLCVCTVILGPCCLLSAMTASAAVEIKRPGARKKLVFPLINCQAEQQHRESRKRRHSALVCAGQAWLSSGWGERRDRNGESTPSGISWYYAVHAGLRHPASVHLAQKPIGEQGVTGFLAEICTLRRAADGEEGGAAQWAPAPGLEHSPVLSCQGQLITSLS